MFPMWKWIKVQLLISQFETGTVRENSDNVDKLRAIGPVAVKPLIRALSSKNYNVKLESIRALGLIGDTRAVPDLEKMLHHKDKIVRQYVEQALATLRPRRNTHRTSRL